MLIFSGLHLFHPNNPNSIGGVFRWQNLIFKLNTMLVLPMLSLMFLVIPQTSGEDLYFSLQAVTCFITTLIGFDIPYLEPSRVSKIFSGSLTCLTLACNPAPLLSLATCLKPNPSGFPTDHFSLPNPTSQKLLIIFSQKLPLLPLPSQKTLNPTILSIFLELYLLPNNGRISGLVPFIVIY